MLGDSSTVMLSSIVVADTNLNKGGDGERVSKRVNITIHTKGGEGPKLKFDDDDILVVRKKKKK